MERKKTTGEKDYNGQKKKKKYWGLSEKIPRKQDWEKKKGV